MSVRSLLAALALAATLVACGDDDEVAPDAASTPEDAAAPAADARTCPAWRLETATNDSIVLLDGAFVHPDRSARLLVRTFQCPGDDPAMPSVAPTLENEFLVVQMRVWRAFPFADCDEPEVVDRPVTVRFPYAGTWTVLANTDLIVDVVGAPDIACGVTTVGCIHDCDCATGEVCLSGTGLGGPFTACARDCELDRDCLGDGTCVIVDDGLSYVCEPGIDECVDGTRACPDGFSCNAGTCEPDFTLNQTSRHACSCDADCDAPLRCVWPETAAEGRCDIACPTAGPGWCQGAHVCAFPGQSVEPGSDSVCAWLGD